MINKNNFVLGVCTKVRLMINTNKLGGGGVQGQSKGQPLMSIFAAIDYIWLAICQSKIYEKKPPRKIAKSDRELPGDYFGH